MVFALSGLSEVARRVDDAFLWIGGICLVLLAGITAVMVIFLVKYRAQKNREAKQIEGNLALELTWIVIPTLIVIFMFYKGYEGFKLIRTVPEDAMTVRVDARQWSWTFIYPEVGVSSPILYAPKDTPVRLLLTTPDNDVVHSLYLPAFRVKEDVVPGRENYLWFEAEQEGTYNIFCAEYCGKDHSKMITTLEVLSPEAYEAWLAKAVADKNKPVVMETALDPRSQEIQERNGSKLYATYCATCHGDKGQGGLIEGARDFRILEGWKQGVKITDIFRTLKTGVPGTQMRSFENLPNWDLFALAHQVASFHPSDRPEPSAEEAAALVENYRLGERPQERKTLPIEAAMRAIVEEAKGGE